MSNALCERCKSLNLSIAKFRIKDKNGDENNRSPELTSSRCYYGTVTQIRDSAENCKLCELIADTVRDANVPHMDEVACYLHWEMDGRTSARPLVGHKGNRTRRLRVCWSDSRLKSCEAYVMLAAPPKYDKSDVDYPGLLNDETQFLGRRIGSSHNKKNLVREFLRLCETCHDERCTAKLGIEDPFRDTLNEPYFGVIDIENESLVPLPYTDDGVELCFEAYATVSYVWGSGHSRQHATRISNIQSRRKSGGLSAVVRSLPKSLRQSIDLIHQLGIRYIWIDALCIVQDSRHSWNLNARAMHLIYGNSVLTICAADGTDANAGLLALDDNHKTRQMVVNYGPGVCLMLHRPAETSIETTQWNRRAWTFQERLLSKRCLIFTEGRIFFQCRSTGMSEDVFSDRLGRGWSLDLVRAPLQMLSQLKVRAMWFYAHCVALYTIRDLYEPFDILAAFSGMCKLMEKTIRAPFAFGLPTSHFDLALLWQPVGRSALLKEANVSSDPKYKDMRFPSWSWCGWNSQGAIYNSEMVGGCLADVRTWILNHTWIDWHIRDGYGTLRRVWDTRHSGGDESEDVRWRGYETVTAREKADDDRNEEETDTSNDNLSSSSDFEEKSTAMRSQRRRSMTESSRRLSLSLKSKSKAIRKLQKQLSVRFSSQTDKFGRTYLGLSTLPKVSTDLSPEFTLTLPEDPYNVLTTETTQTSIPSSSIEEFPDQPFLQFFTWRTEFHVIRRETQSSLDLRQRPDGPEGAQTEPAQYLCRCEISDRRGDKCGSVVVDSEWLRNKESERQTMFEFIAISDAKDFTHEEFPDWTYYIAKERIESEWDLYFVLLVEFYPEEGIYRRVALGKVFKAAFTHLVDKEWKEIILS
ncbi:HET-domain-containing protein [Fusarium austroafricanum]|uniref:HET-domain-containing protein n=1 Tax=Fusarium austroafricanum TaxID=2364996 RepID=A0A8H4P627_9HYPO|nr:HET-domain-containing protein [Fusarium austroafricanum]